MSVNSKLAFALLMAALNIVAGFSKPINLKAKTIIQHGCSRVPSATKVEADYETGMVNIKTYHCDGIVCVNIYDEAGNIIRTNIFKAKESNNVDISNLPIGNYILEIVTENQTYTGFFLVSY